MKKILRSVINCKGSLDEEDIQRNLFHLADSRLEFISDEDQKIWEWVLEYARTWSEPPMVNSVRDYFEKDGALEILDRIEEIEGVSSVYTKSDFENLVKATLKEQNERDTAYLLKDAGHILTNGMTLGTGRSKKHYEGFKDALRFIHERSDRLMMSDSGQLFRSDITKDADEVRKEFRNTLANAQNSWGRGTGLDIVDSATKGIKPGELWIHAAYTGELKCVRGNALIFNHLTKKLERVEDLYERGSLPKVTALKKEGAEPKMVTAKTSHLVQNGVRPVYTVTLESGRELEVTDNHPLWASKGGCSWQELKDLEEGDWVGIPSVMRVPEPRDDFSNEEVKALGYLLGDGSVTDYSAFDAKNVEIMEDFVTCLDRMGFKEGSADYITPTFRRECDGERLRISHSAGNGNSDMKSPLRTLLEDLGLWGTSSKTKHIPGELFGLPDEQIALLLGSLWSADGSCHTGDHVRKDRDSLCRRHDITYASVSKKLATGVQGLLLRLGIQSTVRPINTTYEDEPYTFYCVRVVTNPSKKLFCELIKVVGKEDLFETLKNRIPDTDNRRFPSELLSPLGRQRVTPKDLNIRYAHHATERDSIEAKSLRYFSELDHSLKDHLEGEVAWDRIESITLKGEEMTYDLSVPEHHSFVVNDVITHNTTFALNWAYKTAMIFKYNVYYYSLEMPVKQIRKILYVMHSNHPKFKRLGYEPLDYTMIRDGMDGDANRIPQKDIDFFNMVIEDFEQGEGKEYGSIFVECPKDDEVTMPMLRNRIEMTHNTTPIHLVCIDYLGLMSSKRKRSSNREELNSIFRDAKQMCLTFNRGERIPIVALHQINREGKKEATKNDGRYTPQALADTSAAERTADVITYTYLDDELKEDSTTKIGCIKNRDGTMFDPFIANIHFPSRFISNKRVATGNVGLSSKLV